MKLSTCLVLKNEGPTIYKCLDSVKTFTDEYVIGIDDTTSDTTRTEIERFFTDNPSLNRIVYDFKWEQDFSKARNEGMDKASGDYLFIMDGHEYVALNWYCISEGRRVDSQRLMKNFVIPQIDKDQPDEVYFQLYQQPFIGETPNNYFLQPRVYRNKKDIRFNRAAHNTILNTAPSKAIQFTEIILIHDAPVGNRDERKLQRAEMNIKALTEDLAKNVNDYRAMFYLGNTELEIGNYEKAIYWYDKYITEQKQDNIERYQCYLHKIMCVKLWKQTGWEDRSITSCFDAIKCDYKRRDAYVVLAEIYMELAQYDKAIYYLNICKSLPAEATRMFQSGISMSWGPYLKLAKCYEELGDMELAIANYKIVYNYLPTDDFAKKIKTLCNDKSNVLIIDRIGSFTGDLKKALELTHNVVYSKIYDQRLCKWADLIWAEWGDEQSALACLNHPDKTTLRIHGYEAYLNDSFLSQIPFNSLNRTVFVCQHIAKKVVAKYGIQDDKYIIIPNGVDISKYFIKGNERNEYNIGIVGFMSVKKNPMRLANIIKKNPKYIFNLRIEWQDPFIQSAFAYETKDCKNIVYHGRYDNLNDFWNQMSSVISTSDTESFSFNVAEAMACGCRPYVYNWEGAKEIWEDYVFEDMPKFKKEVTDEDRLTYRRYIITRYNGETMTPKMISILTGK